MAQELATRLELTTGERIEVLMKRTGLGPKEIHRRLGVSDQTFINYRSGKDIPLRRAARLAEILGTSLAFLACMTDDPSPLF